MLDNLKNIPVILGSQSPRRKELLAGMGVDFDVVVKETDESFDPDLLPEQIVASIAEKKAAAFNNAEYEDHLLITADTIVVAHNTILGKPQDRDDAFRMLSMLSDDTHQVMTAVSVLWKGELRTFVECTDVVFPELSTDEINYYLEHYKPYDKAGAYGIQEWMGIVAIDQIKGSYTNVVGLPTARLYQELKNIK
ncbi:Maf family protein [Sphingobacterium spiritivorum]|uniref:dTTP/UTP pyrophosphatase n=1 Tax=Sphingobacterium spiritivorum ATCC 33861 TaxID=525373 RepID=D7VGN7_SPHSI|nr:Maf family protein [Sphingobacterium spiritivorum]EFK59239.1 septum formation protein Maf [Sphingobacterium spiritivorum ATCC 33861]QQT34058.1 septum formation protein Maf [Sphingobacterium spiritivorum]WQD34887.1 Maf family protein [Sphingobacterium spiritivorum]SUI98617.1 Septum formation protein Maf [Sphingobacterium spiritivorum]